MKERIIFDEIPGGNKYHSAIFTTFSFNMYYWDIQVIKELRAKGIEHISALIDEQCLSEQFELYSGCLGDRKSKGYSLYGYHSDMSFHPKIIFLAGENSALALVGSGNVTPSGHGNNIEVWCPIAADSKDDPTYNLIREIWAYISSLYKPLGEEAQKYIGRVEDNCILLRGEYESNSECIVGGKTIRFFANGIDGNLFHQISNWIGDEEIKEITIMTPFYDENANLIKEFNKRFSPKQIRMIIQKNFGALPYPDALPDNVEIYDWQNCTFPFKSTYLARGVRDFHSKCITLRGKVHSYMMVGSANASIAAMGGENKNSLNHEAIIAIKAEQDLWKETGVLFNNKMMSLPPKSKSDVTQSVTETSCIWIKEISYDNNSLTINYSSVKDIDRCNLVVYTTGNEKLMSFELSISKGENKGTIKAEKWNKLPLYANIIASSNEIISNRQFMINSITMAECDPSPMNVEFRRHCIDLENGSIINNSICKFLHDICVKDKYNRYRSFSDCKEEKEIEEQTDNFVSSDDYKKDADESLSKMNLKLSEKTKYEQNLLNSILSYLLKVQNSSEEEKFEDEEDTDDENLLNGKESPKDKTTEAEKVKAEKTFKDISNKLFKSFEEYYCILVGSVSDPKKELKKENFSEVNELNKCFMSILILGGYMNHYVKVCETYSQQENNSLPLLLQTISNGRSVTYYVYSIVSLFGLKNIQNAEFKEKEQTFYLKESYKKLFELACGLMSVCDVINKGKSKYEAMYIQKPSAILNLRDACDYKMESIEETTDYIYKHYVAEMLPDMELDEYEVKNAIKDNLEFLDADIFKFPDSSADMISQNELLETILFNKKTGYVTTNKFFGATRRFCPISWSGLYDTDKKVHTLLAPVYEKKEYYGMITNLSVEQFLHNQSYFGYWELDMNGGKKTIFK